MKKFRNILKDFFSASKRRWYFFGIITCFVLTICVILPIVLKKDISDGLVALEQSPIFENTESTSFINYYIPEGENSFICSFDIRPASVALTPIDITAKFFAKCRINNIFATDFRFENANNDTSEKELDILILYLEKDFSENLSDTTLKCLVNTLSDEFCVKYVKLFFNENTVYIGENSPELGFSKFPMTEINKDIIFENPKGYDITVPYQIKVIDKFGNALKGLAVRAEYLRGEAGLYDADYHFTDEKGELVLNIHPNASYTLFVQQLSCISYTDKISSDVLREISFDFEIKNADSITVIWDETLYKEVTPETTNLLIKVFDEYYSPIPNLTVSILSVDDGSSADIGFTDELGIAYWYNFNEGDYYIRLKNESESKILYYNVNLIKEDNILKLLWE